jgi:hypothetical protein
MAKPKQPEFVSEWDLVQSAGEFLTREYQSDHRFIRVDYWRECGEFGLWLCVSELIEGLPETFMDFDLDQKVIEDG